MTTLGLFGCSCENRRPVQQPIYTQPQGAEPVPPPPTIADTAVEVALSCASVPVEASPQPQPQPEYQPPPQPEPEPLDFDDKKPDDYEEASAQLASNSPTQTPIEAPPITQAPLIATGLGMILDDGTTIRFADETRVPPSLEAGPADGRYMLTIHYQPQRPGDLIGRPLTDADRFVAVSLNLVPVLVHQGLLCDRLLTLAYRVNGSEVARIGDLPLTSGLNRFDLPSEFRTASSRASPSNRSW